MKIPAFRGRWLAVSALSLLAVRGLLASDLQIYTTGDQAAYLAAAELFLGSAAAAPPLRAVNLFHDRLPGFPLYLAPFLAVSRPDVWGVLLAQALLGTASGLLAWRLARQLGTRRLAALAAGAFVGCQPVYLFAEHQVMAEPLALCLTLAGAVLLVRATRRGTGWSYVWAGLAFSASLVTRSNGLLFVTALALGVILAVAPRPRWRPLAAFLLGATCFVAPWVVRNRIVEGRWVLSANVPTAYLVYLIQHGVFDPDRPSGRELLARGFEPRNPNTLFDAIKSLDPNRIHREQRVRPMILDQLRWQKRRLTRAMVRATAVFLGFGTGPTPLRNWLEVTVSSENPFVSSTTFIRRETMKSFLRTSSQGEPARPTSRTTEIWRRLAEGYLRYGRLPLVVAFLAASTVAARRRAPLLLSLGLAYLATAGFHGVLLADHDRFVVQWDWVLVLVALAAFLGPAAARPGEVSEANPLSG